MKNKEIMVSILCITYNHKPYIKKMMESVINQKTNFNFEVIINDDASTDGTVEILKEYELQYPNLIKVIYQTINQYSQGIENMATYLYPLAKGKYIAMCEGDDSWADSTRLQKQIDFLEKNLDYSATAGKSRYIDDDERITRSDAPRPQYCGNSITAEQYLKDGNFGSNTLVHRSSILLDETFVYMRKQCKVGDILIILKVFDAGKVYIFDSLFENHRVQTRINASNYGAIYSSLEKFRNDTDVIVAVDFIFGNKFDLRKWYFPKVAKCFVRHIFQSKALGEVKKIYSRVPQSYRCSIWKIVISYSLYAIAGKFKQM